MEEGKLSKDWPHEWIKKIRSRPTRRGSSKRMRQIDLAKRVGVDPRTVQQWENGDRLPSVGNLKLIIQAFWEEGLFLEIDPAQEADQLWLAVKRFSEARSATGREFPEFDATWFATLAVTESLESNQTRDVKAASFPSVTATIHLPRLASNFVGRHQSKVDLVEQLRIHSLVSIVGSGGIGKTTLAVEVASSLIDMYPDGVWMFEFGVVNESHDLGQLLLATLGLQNQANKTDLQAVMDRVANRKLLFIFDNCEQLIDAIAATAESLLSAAPGLTILATSREPFNIAGESVYRIPPLSYPADDCSLQGLHEQELLQFEAVQLFLERARILVPQFQPTLTALKRIATICKKVEGIPLAIELAVARMNMLTLEQIEERLANLLTLLTAGKRTAAPRHQTLRSTIDWSYNLLTGKERLLLRRLSVFAGGFTLEAAEEVCICEPGMPDHEDRITREDMLDLLSGLVNKSLVTTEVGENYGMIRYFMLGAIKEYAGGKLQEDSNEHKQYALAERHAQFYIQCLEREEPKFRTREREACIEAVRRDYANLRSALQWSYVNPQAHSFGLHIVSKLYWFWLHEGRLKEGLYWLDRFLDSHSDIDLAVVDGAKALHGQGVIRFVQGNIQGAMDATARSVEIARHLQEKSLLASCLRLSAFLHIKMQRMEEAETLAQQSVDIARSTGDSWNLASSLHAYGRLRLEQKKYDEATILLRESVQLFESVHDQWEVSGPYECLGYAALKLMDVEQSIAYFKKCIVASQIYNGSWILSRGLEGLGLALYGKNTLLEAIILLGAAEKGRQNLDAENTPNFPVEYEEAILTLQHTVSDQEFREWWTKGRDMSQAQALAYALEI
ncbi:tetratricopeptide repeat protein [Paenibacillus xylanexedens]|uniref:tetratricopeptide repeat protein n=1 Tax=Paenibacillus xylanexedens TaxID=528191 RepID=UPI0011A84965|nr:tetratricopeptide repeat protein [Paenibacillus xylanexedens]